MISCVSEKQNVESFQSKGLFYRKHDAQPALLLTVVVAHELVSGGFGPIAVPLHAPSTRLFSRPEVHAMPHESDASRHVAVRALVYLPFNRPRVHPVVPSAKDKTCP